MAHEFAGAQLALGRAAGPRRFSRGGAHRKEKEPQPPQVKIAASGRQRPGGVTQSAGAKVQSQAPAEADCGLHAAGQTPGLAVAAGW
jgi:hypothetical protein